ncbi:MAG: hypothetical protein WBO24_14015 [Nitrospirales bacterium]
MVRQIRKELKMHWVLIISVLLVFFLQGCTTPLVNVDVKVGKCAPGETIDGVGLCGAVDVTSQTTFTNAMGHSVTCAANTKKCQIEGDTTLCSRGKKCTTVDQGGNQCVCKCQP